MNNPPDVSPTEHETEHYAHEVSKHVRGYLLVGATLLVFTALTVALSYVHLGSQKANVAVALLVATFKAGLVAYIFMHLSAEKKLIYRILIFTAIFVLGLFWLTFLAWYDPVVHQMSLKGFHIVFITFSTLLAFGIGVWCLWINSMGATTAYTVGAIFSFAAAVALIVYGCWFWRKMKRLRLI